MKINSLIRTVIIGDSMFWSGMPFFGGQPSPLSKWLETWSGHNIENHALVGASLEDGWIKSIHTQFLELDNTPKITTLIMDGGGNDVISHRKDCEYFNTECLKVINNSLSIANDILNNADVDNIIYLGFYYLSGLKVAADYADSKVRTMCKSVPNCYFVDPRYNETSGTGLLTPQMLGNDLVHPNEEGYKLLAQMIWNTTIKYNITI